MSRRPNHFAAFSSLPPATIESLESRRLLDGTLPQGLLPVFSYAQTNFQSILIDLTFQPAGPLTIDAGQTIAVQTTSNQTINVYCSDAQHAVLVDGAATTGTSSSGAQTYDYTNGEVNADPGVFVPVSAGEHNVVFTLLATATTEDPGTSTETDGVTPLFTGPWVIANGNDAGSIFSSPLPFSITGSNHLVFTQPPTTAAANAAITPPITVTVEDANNAVVIDNDSVITLAPLVSAGIDPTAMTGTPTATMVNGVATFSGISLTFNGSFVMYAAAGGFANSVSDNGFVGPLEPVGMFVESSAFSIGPGGGGGGGGGGSASLTVTLKKSTLPASVVSGGVSHGSELISVANSGATTTGTVAVYASSDGSIDGTSTPIGTTGRLTFRAGRATTANVLIRSLPASLDGTYTLLAQVTDAAGTTFASTTGPSITAAAPFIAFSETIIKTTLPPSDISGQKTRAAIQLRVTNDGNIISSGPSTVALFASPDQTAADGTPIRNIPGPIVLKPGASRTLNLSLQSLPAVVDGQYFIIAQVTDPKADVTSIATPGTFTLAHPFIAFQFGTATTTIAGHGKGPANVSFTLTNNGNIPSTGPSAVNFFVSNAGIPTGSAVYTKSMTLLVQPDRTRTFHVSVPVAETATLAAAAEVTIQVIDPKGNVQIIVLPF